MTTPDITQRKIKFIQIDFLRFSLIMIQVCIEGKDSSNIFIIKSLLLSLYNS